MFATAEGHGTIGIGLLREGTLDTVVVQVGDGALITGIARWLKAQSPDTFVVGVCASGAPAMKLSADAGRPLHSEPRRSAGLEPSTIGRWPRRSGSGRARGPTSR